MGETGREIAIQDWVHCQNIIAGWVVEVSLISNVVEIWEVLTEISLVLTLFQNVLSLVPIPSLINLTEIFYYQVIALDALFPFTKYAEAFRVHPEVGIDLTREIPDSPQENR